VSHSSLAHKSLVPDLTELRRVEVALLKSEAKHQALLDAIPDLLLRISRDGTLLDCRVGEFAPYRPPSQVLGKKVPEVLPAEVAQPMMRCLEQAWQTGKTQVFEYQLSTLDRAHDYEARMVVSGEEELLVIIRDITERKWAEREALQRERLTALGMLAASLAHEVNNPLQILKSHLDLLLDFPLEAAESKQYLHIMRHQIERLSAITRRALNFANPQPAPRQLVSVHRLVRQVLGFAAKQLRESGFQVSANLKPVPLVLAAPDQLEQVLLNLVLNAIESAPAHGRLDVAAYLDGPCVAITVTSNSPPIPDDILPHIFEAFFTTKPAGSGLGLWISHNLVQQHQGALTAENLADGRGVVFTVTLPRPPAQE